MAINFPNTPVVDDIYTEGGSSWQWDGTAWNALGAGITPPSVDQFKTFNADTGTTTANTQNDVLTVAGGTDVTTSITGDILTINASVSAGDSNQNAFSNVGTDAGTVVASTTTDTFNIQGGTKIATQANDKTITIDVDNLGINDLIDVDTASSAPSSGQVLKWNGVNWAPGTDATSGGGGSDADTLDGFDGSYYLNYNNLSNRPNINSFTTVTVNGQNNVVADAASDTITYVAGSGISLTTNAVTDSITFENSAPNVDQNIFKTFNADSGTTTANSTTDTLTIAGGTGLTSNLVGDTLTLNVNSSLSFAGETTLNAGSNNLNLSTTNGDVMVSANGGRVSIESAVGNLEILNTAASPANVKIQSAGGVIFSNGTTQYIFPVNDGTADQVLQTNGSGVLSFADVSGGGGGEANQNAFSTIAVAGQSNIEADTATDTLNVAAGAGISLTNTPGTDTITITNTVSAGAANFIQLGDIAQSLASGYGSNLTPDQIFENAIVTLRVGATGNNSAYLFNSHYSGNNPTIYALSGTTIAFDLTGSAGHPFEIQDGTGTAYNIGLVHVGGDGSVNTGSNAQNKEFGTLYWRIPESISGGYRYQCTAHAPMVGSIQVKRFSAI
jgi:plastocyanin|tara:strand:- start:34539 stop:36380 length:1842 start_codon:yes stop_codon:yes gene_type:complete